MDQQHSIELRMGYCRLRDQKTTDTGKCAALEYKDMDIAYMLTKECVNCIHWIIRIGKDD